MQKKILTQNLLTKKNFFLNAPLANFFNSGYTQQLTNRKHLNIHRRRFLARRTPRGLIPDFRLGVGVQRGSRSRSRMTDFAEICVTRAAASRSASGATLHKILTSQPEATRIRRSSYTNINAEARDEHEHAWREMEKRGGHGAYITRTPPSPAMAMTAKSANNKQASDQPNKRATHTACVVSSVERHEKQEYDIRDLTSESSSGPRAFGKIISMFMPTTNVAIGSKFAYLRRPKFWQIRRKTSEDTQEFRNHDDRHSSPSLSQ